MFRVRVTGDKWWKDRVYYLSRDGIGREATMPAFRKLDRALRQTLTDLFKPQTNVGEGQTYAHGYTGNYLMNLHSLVTADTLKIIEGDPTGGRNIREGGPGGSYDEVFQWAIDKLGVGPASAGTIARSVEEYGIGRPDGRSPLLEEHPAGVGMFRFPEWIVTYKNKRDIDEVAKQVDRLVVRYLN